MPWSDTQKVLETAQIFWVTTVRPDGRPHSTPLVAVWLDDALHFCTGETEQKAHNLAANPNVLLTTGDNGWKSGIDVVVEGAAARVTDDELLGRLAAGVAGEVGRAVAVRGARRRLPPLARRAALVFRVEPTKVLAFGKGTFTHTRHRF